MTSGLRTVTDEHKRPPAVLFSIQKHLHPCPQLQAPYSRQQIDLSGCQSPQHYARYRQWHWPSYAIVSEVCVSPAVQYQKLVGILVRSQLGEQPLRGHESVLSRTARHRKTARLFISENKRIPLNGTYPTALRVFAENNNSSRWPLVMSRSDSRFHAEESATALRSSRRGFRTFLV